MAEFPAGEYVLVSDMYPAERGTITFFFGDLVDLSSTEAQRLGNAGSIVDPDSEDGQLILSGMDRTEAKRRILERNPHTHIVHRPTEPLTASSQGQPPQQEEEPEAMDPNDSEQLDRLYANNGPDWEKIRGRQSGKAPERGP